MQFSEGSLQLLWSQWVTGGLEWKGDDNRELLEVRQKACWRKVVDMERA